MKKIFFSLLVLMSTPGLSATGRKHPAPQEPCAIPLLLAIHHTRQHTRALGQALINAANSGDQEEAERLINAGADIHAQRDEALRQAHQNEGGDHGIMVTFLLDRGAMFQEPAQEKIVNDSQNRKKARS